MSASVGSAKLRFSLSSAALDALLGRLDEDRNRAAEKYAAIHRRLVKLFECRGSTCPEDHADETIDRVARRLLEGEEIRAADPALYFCGVARNVWREHVAERQKHPVRLANLAVEPIPAQRPPQPEGERRVECLNRCLRKLPAATSTLILDYYTGDKLARVANRSRLADRLGLPLNALRIRMHRVRERLETCVRNCLAIDWPMK